MTKECIVVVGAGYGDEGKGKMTDYFVRRAQEQGKNAIVVRYNGGAQAGHCVRTDKHTVIHSHYGSGTLAGAPTYLGSKFIVNPVLWKMEYDKLIDLGIDVPMCTINPNCYVTTPYDMFVNSAIENWRGNNRHGSCGAGIFETIDRSKTVKLTAGDLFSCSLAWLVNKFERIRNHLFERIALIDLDDETKWLFDPVNTAQVATAFWHEQLIPMRDQWLITPNPFTPHDYIVFEGAQGLFLGTTFGTFPHMTPSDPGVKYCAEIALENNLTVKEVCYVTRVYLTRHGNGPLPGECTPSELGIDTSQETNKFNQYQGNFRYAPLTEDVLRATTDDFASTLFPNYETTTSTISHAITCIDHVAPEYADQVISSMFKLGRKLYLSTNGTGDANSVTIVQGERNMYVTEYLMQVINADKEVHSERVEAFTEIQAQSVDSTLSDRGLFIRDAQKLVAAWNRAARGHYIYKVIEP